MKVIQIDCHSMQHEVVADIPFNSAYIDREGITEDEIQGILSIVNCLVRS